MHWVATLWLAMTAASYAAGRPLPVPVLFEPGLISTADHDSHLVFEPDGRTLYFVRSTPDFQHWTILTSRFASGRWSAPEVAPFSGRYSDADVSFSRDGTTLFFISNRPVPGSDAQRRDTEIWTMRRSAGGWSEPRHGAALSSPGNESFPTLAEDDTLYFGSERPGSLGHDTSDIWRSRAVNGEYTAPESLGEAINTSDNEIEPYVAPDQSYVIVAAKGRSDSRGSYDLYVAHRCGSAWTPLSNLGDTVNSVGWEFAPRVSPDGRYLFYTSNRSGFDEARSSGLTTAEPNDRLHGPGNGLFDVYQVDLGALDLRSACPAS